MAELQDIVIVGGGPSGMATALSLLRAFPRVRDHLVVLEKATFPRDKPCAGAIGGRGERILERLGVHVDVPSAVVSGVSIRFQDGSVQRTLDRPIGRVVRRIEFDHALSRIAIERGVQLRDGTGVEALEPSGRGTLVHTSAGPIDARVVVGADGVGSLVRRSMGLSRGLLRAQALEVDTEPLPGDADRHMLRFDASDRRLTGYFWDFPTLVEGKQLVSRGIYHLKIDRRPVDIRALLAGRLAGKGLTLSSYTNKRFAERGYVPRGELADDRAVLVGEAAGIDPVSGEGIAQALEYGWLAGRFLGQNLRWRRPLRDWTGYMRRSRLAFDLAIRVRSVHAFYGPERADAERFLFSNPDALHVSCEHFAHVPYSKGKLARTLLKAAPLASRTVARAPSFTERAAGHP